MTFPSLFPSFDCASQFFEALAKKPGGCVLAKKIHENPPLLFIIIIIICVDIYIYIYYE